MAKTDLLKEEKMLINPNNTVYFGLLENYNRQTHKLQLSAYQYPKQLQKAWDEAFIKQPQNKLQMKNLLLIDQKRLPDCIYAFMLIDCQSNLYSYEYDADGKRLHNRALDFLRDLDKSSLITNSALNDQNNLSYHAINEQDKDLWRGQMVRIPIEK